MKLKTLIAAAIAGAFALPLAAQASADNDWMILAQSGGPSGASATGTGPTGGTPSPQSAGEPQSPATSAGATTSNDATTRCQGMTGTAREDCMRDANRATTGSTAGSASGGTTTSPSGSGTTGTTAGPGSASEKTAPSAATATSPDTTGQGKPK